MFELRPIKQLQINYPALALLVISIPVMIYGIASVSMSNQATRIAMDEERRIHELGDEMMLVSDFLTKKVRSYAFTGDRAELFAFWTEVNNTRRRERILAEFQSLGLGSIAGTHLEEAKRRSDELINTECRAMRLVEEAKGIAEAQMPERIAATRLSALEEGEGPAEKLEMARRLVFGFSYESAKSAIYGEVRAFIEAAQARSRQKLMVAENRTTRALVVLFVAILCALVGSAIAMILNFAFIYLPIKRYNDILLMEGKDNALFTLPLIGCLELRELAEALNKRSQERATFERAMMDTQLKFSTHLRLMPLAAIEIDDKRRIVLWNSAAEQTFGWTSEEAMGEPIIDLLVPQRMREEIGELMDGLDRGTTVDINVNSNVRKDGTELICEWYNTPLIDSTGKRVGWASMVRDITEERKEEERILYLSRHDPLTDLYNRRYMLERLEEEQRRFERTGNAYSLVMLDIDRFKVFNDDYGHECGDLVLIEVSIAMRDVLRGTDSVSRWGGEEFLVLLPETGIRGAKETAEKIRSAVAQRTIGYRGRRLGVTVSAGVASCPELSIDGHIKEADIALLQAKAAGRNRVYEAKRS